MAKQPVDPIFSVTAPKAPARHTHVIFIVLAGIAAVVYLVIAYLVLPREMSAVWQRFCGLASAGLAVGIYMLATHRGKSAEDVFYRLRRGQHSDFGKQLRLHQQQPRTVNLPVVGKTSVRALGGVAAFLVVGCWWLTPWAPVAVEKSELIELMVPLGEEIVVLVLVMPGTNVALPQPPVPSLSVRRLARQIRDDAEPYQLGMKATALSQFEQARVLLDAALKSGAEPQRVSLARAQNEMYAGRFRDAAHWYGEALAKTPDDPLVLCQQAVAWIQAGEFAKAEPVVQRASKAAQAKHSGKEKDPILATCLRLQAVLPVLQGKDLQGEAYKKAQQKFVNGRTILKDFYGPNHPFVAASLNNQATVYLLRGNYHGAEDLYTGAYDAWSASVGPQQLLTAAGLGNLGMLDLVLGRYAQAEKRLQQALAIRTEDLPEQHPLRALSLDAFAAAALAENHCEQARAPAQAALTIAEKQFGPEHPAVAVALHTLASLYAQQARYTKAEAFCRRALAVAEKAWGPKHPYVGFLLNSLAELDLVQGRYERAAPLCQRALDISKETFGKGHVTAAAALLTLGRLEIRQDKPGEARAHLEEALKIQQELFGKEHPDIARTLASLASLCNTPRTYADGVGKYNQAIQMAEKYLGGGHPEVASLLVGLAALHADRDKYVEAEPYLSRALSIEEKAVAGKALVPNHPDLAATLEAYAAVLRKLTPPAAERAAAMESRVKTIRQKHAEEDRSE
jgi:tetratricopeptide (TPR) repeat protein